MGDADHALVIPSLDGLSDMVLEVMEDVAPARDAFDRADFDAVAYLNEAFPNEQALAGTEAALERLTVHVRRSEGELVRRVQQQSVLKERSQTSLDEARQSIRELLARIDDIKRKADESETMVQEICHDIRALDVGKRNLTTTHNALQKLKMLVVSVEKLEELMETRAYKEMGGLLLAIAEFEAYFAPYNENAKIAVLRQRVDGIRRHLRSLIFVEFEGLGAVAPAKTANLAHACAVVDALGEATRRDLIETIVEPRMKAYTTRFMPGSSLYELEHAVERFVWLQQELRTYDRELSAIFPDEWRLDERIVEAFVEITGEHFKVLLDRMSLEGSLTVKLLTSRLHDTLEFEKKLGKRFADDAPPADASEPEVLDPLGDDSEDEAAAGEPEDRAAAIRRRIRRYQESMKRRENLAAVREYKRRNRFRGALSERFDAYMGLYIDDVNATVTEHIAGELQAEQQDATSGAVEGVLASAQDLMVTINGIMDECAKLSRSQPLFDMYKRVIKRHLNKYAKSLQGKLPAVDELLRLEHTRFSDADMAMVLLTVNSAAYLSDLMDGLANKLRGLINEAFREDIDVSKEKQAYDSLLSAAIKALAAGVENRTQAPLSGMVKINWAAVDAAADQSDYVVRLGESLSADFQRCHDALDSQRFSYFCETFASSFVPRVLEYVRRCRSISEIGAEQLLLDVTAIKSVLLSAPGVGQQGDRARAARHMRMYKKIVSTKGAEIINMLKVLMAPQDSLLETYRTLFPDGSEDEFKRLLDLRGIKRDTAADVVGRYREAAQAASRRIARPLDYIRGWG